MRLIVWQVALFTCIAVFDATAQSGRERSAFSFTHEGSAKLSRGGNVELNELELRTGYPVYRSDGLRVIAGLRWTRYDFGVDGPELEDFVAHSVRFPIRASGDWREPWSWMGMVAPAVRSDLENLSSDDLGISAMVLAMRPLGERWRLTLGAVYSQDFGRSRLFPAIGALWTNQTWSVDLQFPRPRATYRVTDSFVVGAGMEPGGDQWNVEVKGTERDVALKEYRAGVGFEWTPVRNLAIQGQTGYVFGRELDARGGGLPRLERDIDETWYARIALVFR